MPIIHRKLARRCLLGTGLASVAALGLWLATGGASAQVVAPRPALPPGAKAAPDANAPSADEAIENVFVPAERLTLQRLSKARELLDQGRYGEAVQNLGGILDGAEDFFFQPDRKAPIHRSVKAEAQRLLGRMPREGRELYELQYGARARQMLDEAVAAGDVARVAEVSRRFFHTKSGYQATFLLGLNHFDHGRPLAGALNLQRLREALGNNSEFEPVLSMATATCWLQAGMADKAREVLAALRENSPSRTVEVGGRRVPLFQKDSEAIDWLVAQVGAPPIAGPAEADRWLMFRGDAARNAAASGSSPLLNMRWRVPSAVDPVLEESLEHLRRGYAEQNQPTLPSLHPLAVDDVILMRTANNLLAIDFATGKRLWLVQGDEAGEAAGLPGGELGVRQSTALAALMGQRVTDDLTYGTMSSDGRCVFTIEDLGLGFGAGFGNPVFGFGGGGMGRRVVIGNQRGNGAQPTGAVNRLAAHDIRTGKLKWHLGGASDQFALPLAETFFLGPPLPLMGQLYVLAEIKGEIRLLALEAATGKLCWSQQLVMVEHNVQQDPLRRLAGVSPSYADGILVCPTSTGAIVGVELATRSLLWGYRYGLDRSPNRNGMIVLPPMVNGRAGGPNTWRWSDASVCISEGRILATPVESDSLHCLSLIGGELLWKQPRQEDLYVACVDQEKVVLVGGRTVRALRLADGKPAWEDRKVALPDQSMPSGRGFLNDDHYYLPLSSAQVAEIDIKTGQLAHLAKSRKGNVPGNLVCYKGRVISQGLAGLESFFQLDAAVADVEQRLKINPDDPEALSLRGEILLDAGKRSEAIVCLRRAYELDAEPRTRELLRETLFDGLRTDFAAYRGQAKDIERLLDDSTQQGAFFRLMAGGLQQTGELTAAFEQYQKLIDLDAEHRPLDAVSNTLTVRRDRWLQAQLAVLRSEAKDEAAAQIDGLVDSRLKAAMASNSADDLQRFLDWFGNQPAAQSAPADLVRRLTAAGRLLDAEMALWRGAPSAEPSGLGTAAAEVLALYRRAANREDLASSYEWLARQFPELACCEGKTAKQWLESLPAEDPVRKRVEVDRSWPIGKVETATTGGKTGGNTFGRWALEIRGDPGPFFADISVLFDQNNGSIIGCDGLGQERWKVSLAEEGQPQQSFPFNRNLTYGRACGHLLMLAMGVKIVAIDTLGDGKGGPRVLWTQDLTDGASDAATLRQLPMQIANLPWQLQQMQFAQFQNRANILGPVTSRYVCFQRFRSVLAVDSRTGETLWSRHDVPPGSELFGDDEYIFAMPPDRSEAMLLRALDGELLGTRKVPRPENRQIMPGGAEQVVYGPFSETCLAALGRKLLLWRIEGDKRTLVLFDPLSGRDVWPARKFSASAHADLIGAEAIGVFEPDGQFTLLSLPDGRTLTEIKLEPEKALVEIIMLASGDQYFLLTNSAPADARNNPRPTQPMPGCGFKPISRGRLYAFDRQGRLQWPEPVIIKDQHFLLNQPERLPTLTFACQVYDQRLNGQGGQYRVTVLCVDKRTGRIAYKAESTNPTGVFTVVGNPEKKTVNLNLQRNSIVLTFTDKPIPPGPPPGSEPPAAEKKGSNTTRELWKSVRRIFGQDDSDSDEEDSPPLAVPVPQKQ